MNINEVLNNQNNLYFGHGTGGESKELIDSIMNNGLRCSHGSLYFTSVILGIGTQIEESEKEKLKNWPHKDSKIIIIVSLPLQYKIIDVVGMGTYNKGDAAYYYIPDEKLRAETPLLTNSPYVMPEFIAGYYNAREDSFVSNPKYYEYLSPNEQKELFDKVKSNYFNIIDDAIGIDEYKEILNSVGWNYALTEDEEQRFKSLKEQKEGKSR